MGPDIGRYAYVCGDLGRETQVYIHRSSNAYRFRPSPACIVFNEIITTSKHFMRDCVTVDPVFLSKHSVQAPRYLLDQDRVIAFGTSVYSPLEFTLPSVE